MKQIEQLVAQSRFPEAARSLAALADQGHPEALTTLGHWRVAGNIIRRDLAAALKLFRQAAEAGRSDAGLLHAYFLASGTGGKDDWATALSLLRSYERKEPTVAAQLSLLDLMDLGPDGYPTKPLKPRPLSASPFVAAVDEFMTTAECHYLKQKGEPALQPAMVVDPVSKQMIRHPVRSSDNMIFGVYTEDLVVNALNRRIAALTGTKPKQGEPLQLLRYGPGGEYRAHMDALPNEPNQRIATALIYLTEGYEGGETEFLRAGLTFHGKTGDALFFRNVTADGRADPRTLHAGLPVKRGTKVIASRWIRRNDFHFPPPTPIVPV